MTQAWLAGASRPRGRDVELTPEGQGYGQPILKRSKFGAGLSFGFRTARRLPLGDDVSQSPDHFCPLARGTQRELRNAVGSCLAIFGATGYAVE